VDLRRRGHAQRTHGRRTDQRPRRAMARLAAQHIARCALNAQNAAEGRVVGKTATGRTGFLIFSTSQSMPYRRPNFSKNATPL
jgi:hypothetical protein